MDTTDIPTVVIGGGQAGLSVGYHLAQRDLPFVILDGGHETGEVWRRRWDSLRLFTPARIDGLDGMRFPGRGNPTKDEVADYLQAYADHFRLPVRHDTRVTSLTREGDRFHLVTTGGDVRADNVVIAMSSLQVPKTPPLAEQLAPTIHSLHAHDYRNPEQLPDGGVLVVGAGNSGAQIAVEAARTHATWLAGEPSGALPFRVDGAFGRHVGTRLVRFMFMHVLTTGTPIGRKARPTMLSSADPLMRDRPKELRRAGVQRVPRVTGIVDGRPVVGDGTGEQVLDVATVIWATGYRPGLEWVDIPVLDERGVPRQERGIVHEVPGLYVVGMNFQYCKASETITGVGRDARYVVDHLEGRVRQLVGSAPDAAPGEVVA